MEISDMATLYHAPHFITSAKSGENVELAFRILGKLILEAQVT